MDVTPREVNEKQFRDAWRGYNQEEVDDFLDRVAETLENVQRENESVRSRNIELEQALATTREAEEMLKKTLVTAQRAAEEAIAKAKAKAEQLVNEAESRARGANEEARKIIEQAETEAARRTLDVQRRSDERRRELDNEIARLSAYQSELQRKLRTFLDEQSHLLNELVESEPQSTDRGPNGGRSAPSAPARAKPALISDAEVPGEPATSQRVVHVDPAGDAVDENGTPTGHKRGVRGLFFREEG